LLGGTVGVLGLGRIGEESRGIEMEFQILIFVRAKKKKKKEKK